VKDGKEISRKNKFRREEGEGIVGAGKGLSAICVGEGRTS